VLGRGIEVELPLLFTYAHYEAYEFNVKVPLVFGGAPDHLALDVGSAYVSRPSDQFFGIGNDSPTDETWVRKVNREASIGFSAQVNEAWKTGLHLVYQNVGVTNPPDRAVSALDFFRNNDVPGLFTGANLLGAVLSVDHNTKDREHNATRGGIQHFQAGFNEGIRKGDFAYWKFEFDFEEFFALTRDRRKIVAVRGMTETNQEKGWQPGSFFRHAHYGELGNHTRF
jgi:outer membrane protein assembly factor BamA